MFRLLPATIITAALLVCVKVVAMVQDTESLLITSVEAQQEEKPSNVSKEKPETVGQSAKAAKVDKAEEKKAEAKKEGKSAEGEGKKGEEHGGGHGETEGKKEEDNPAVSSDPGASTDHRYTDVEVELLQNLGRRREELVRWENNIQIKEAALDATQKRIDDKIAQIEGMKKQVAALLVQYNAQEDAKIHSLVKIYENMKPVDAARIFDEVEMPILLLVIDAMSEKKASPILAAMNPKKAKQLTVELANERKLTSNVRTGMDAASAAAASAPPDASPSKN